MALRDYAAALPEGDSDISMIALFDHEEVYRHVCRPCTQSVRTCGCVRACVRARVRRYGCLAHTRGVAMYTDVHIDIFIYRFFIPFSMAWQRFVAVVSETSWSDMWSDIVYTPCGIYPWEDKCILLATWARPSTPMRFSWHPMAWRVCAVELCAA